MENNGQSINLDLSLNTLGFNDFINNKSNLLNNSFVISSYESLYNDDYVNYAYQNNSISIIDNYNNIIPLTYNLKYTDGNIKHINSYTVGIDIDNYTIVDSSSLPRTKTINLTYEYNFVNPINIIDSYSYIISSYEYAYNLSRYSYNVEYNYSLYTYNDYSYNSYSYYIYSYDFKDDDLNISYNIRYTSNDLTYFSYTYNYAYTYLINQFENDFIFVDQNVLNKADNNIGIYKSDLDTMSIVQDSLTINNKYTDILYKNNTEYYDKIYNNLVTKYNDVLLKSSIINSYIFNYKPIENIILNFTDTSEIIYFDKNKEKKIKNNSNIKIDNDIDEFNLCIPFEYSYKSYTEKLNPFDINKILVHILRKKYTNSNNEPVYINGELMSNLFNYDNLFNDDFQQNDISQILNNLYMIKYDSLENYYNVLTDNEIQLNIEKSYLYDNKVKRYDQHINLFYGELKYVFNFKINRNKLSITNNYQFDILMYIKDIVLGGCNEINENYKLSFSFYLDRVETKYVQTYDILYHDYNYGFNFDKHGKKIGICFISEGFNKINPKPVFIKYDTYYNSDINLTNNVVSIFNDLSKNILKNDNKTELSIDLKNTVNDLSVSFGNDDNNTKSFTNNNGKKYMDITSVSIKEEYYEDKIYDIKFNYLKKDISLEDDEDNNYLSLTFSVDQETHKLSVSNNDFSGYMNKIFSFNNYISIPNIFKSNILKKYFTSLYNIRTSGLRHGEFLIPSINDYYIMDLYNILSLLRLDTQLLMTNIFYNTCPAIIELNNYKIDRLYYDNYTNQYLYDGINDIFVVPIFKLPDYSIINNGNYNIIFDNDLNYETVSIKTKYFGFFSLKIKKYYNYKINTSSSNIWYVVCNSNNIFNIETTTEIDEDNNIVTLNVLYQHNTNDNILYFNIYYVDSDPLFNSYKVNNIDCRILCKVIIKIKT